VTKQSRTKITTEKKRVSPSTFTDKHIKGHQKKKEGCPRGGEPSVCARAQIKSVGKAWFCLLNKAGKSLLLLRTEPGEDYLKDKKSTTLRGIRGQPVFRKPANQTRRKKKKNGPPCATQQKQQPTPNTHKAQARQERQSTRVPEIHLRGVLVVGLLWRWEILTSHRGQLKWANIERRKKHTGNVPNQETHLKQPYKTKGKRASKGKKELPISSGKKGRSSQLWKREGGRASSMQIHSLVFLPKRRTAKKKRGPCPLIGKGWKGSRWEKLSVAQKKWDYTCA